jgi:hypothetical protein
MHAAAGGERAAQPGDLDDKQFVHVSTFPIRRDVL